jgi:2-dehydropantoate 2-reductase
VEASENIGIEHVVVLVAGAIGSFYGALLSRKIDALLIGRRNHVDAINDGGLIVLDAIREVFHIRAVDELRSIPDKALIILATKAQASEKAVGGIRHLLRPGARILILQNGLGNEELVKELVGPDVEVIRGLCSSAVEFMLPGEICVKHIRETVLPRTPTGEMIKHLFDSCGLETRLSDEMNVEIWRKLTLNCVINPLTAIFRLPNDEIASNSLRKVKSMIIKECIEVAIGEGVNLSPVTVEEVDAAAASYSNLSSMCQDILRGRKTEIDFLNGKITDLGRKHGVDTPANDVVVAFIRFMEGRRWTLKD